MNTRDPLERAVDRTAVLGTIERAYADGYAAAQREISELRNLYAEASAAITIRDAEIERLRAALIAIRASTVVLSKPHTIADEALRDREQRGEKS